MSFCRFSSNDFKCDIYAYEGENDEIVIHVASERILGDIPKLPPITNNNCEEYLDAHLKQMEFLDTAQREKIGLKYDGDTFVYPSIEEALVKMDELKSLGYFVPSFCIQNMKEAEEENLVSAS